MNATGENRQAQQQPQRGSTVVSSISLDRRIHKRVKRRAKKQGRTLSRHIQYLIERDLQAA